MSLMATKHVIGVSGTHKRRQEAWCSTINAYQLHKFYFSFDITQNIIMTHVLQLISINKPHIPSIIFII